VKQNNRPVLTCVCVFRPCVSQKNACVLAYLTLHKPEMVSITHHGTVLTLHKALSNTPPTKIISRRIFIEFLGIREESVVLCLWGMNPLA